MMVSETPGKCSPSLIDAQGPDEAFAIKGRNICHARNQRLPLHNDRAVIRQKNALVGGEDQRFLVTPARRSVSAR